MSGKVARQKRKSRILSKKTLAMCAGLCISCAPVTAGGEFLLSLFPHFSKPFGESHDMKYGIGGGVRATYRPIKNLNVFAQGDYLSMAMPGISPVAVLEGEVGTGYHLDVNDRISFDFNVNFGVYNAKSTQKITGLTAGGAITFSYKLNPSIYMDVTASGTHYTSKPQPFMLVNAGIAPGITINFTELFNRSTKIDLQTRELAPVFPVLYSWYDNNSFGKVDLTNNEESDITDITISFFQPQYMAHAKECATIRRLPQGETATIDLIAFFNEQILEVTEKTDTNSYVIVNYSRLGKKLVKTFVMDVPVYGRNNMSWDDDRRAAVFVSSKDPAAMQFAKYTSSIVRDNLRPDVPQNIQYALGIFSTLNEFGLNYVVDPTSAFEDNVGTSSIDFLQFPYQTLMYRGGDCDDLSILVCSLFEAVGIKTAFITVPGHIFMAFDSGLTPEQAQATFRNTAEYIFVDDEVWVPLEITLSDDGFYKACRVGAREWNTANAQGTAALYKMSDSWQIYQPISIPGASAYLNIPESDAIYVAFANELDLWSRNELKRGQTDQAIQFVMLKQDEEPEKTETVIKEDPFSNKSLNNIVALASNVAAVPPAAIREEELEEGEERAAGGDDGNDGDEDDELIENILTFDPDTSIATLQTDVTVGDARHPELDSGSANIFQDEFEMSDEDEPLVELEEENPLAEIEAMATAFLMENPYIEKKPETPVVEPVETTADALTDTTPFATVDDLLADATDNPMTEPAETTAAHTGTIIFITTVTISAALAAGIIIYRKKKREEEV